MRLSKPDGLESLGADSTDYVYDGPWKNLLEKFPNPMTGPGDAKITIVAPEFTSLCPKTGQPDYATIVVKYGPREWCVESKSWKMYLGSYRMVGEFHESCVERMSADLIELLDPAWLNIVGEFTPRGGIKFWPERWYFRKD